jgi:hypothetical protein
MALHETIKSTKIINEIIIYLTEKGHKTLHLDFETNDEETIISVDVDKLDDDLLVCLNKDIYAERDEQFEEYGWELMGEDDHSCELQQLSMLIDSFEVVEKEGFIRLILKRKK